MKSSGDKLDDAVKDIYLDPADNCVKLALMSIRKAMLLLDVAKTLHREAYKGQLKKASSYDARVILGTYDTIFDLIKKTSPGKLKKEFEAIIAEGFRRDPKHTFSADSPFKHGRIPVPERLLDILREEVESDAGK